MIISSKRIAQIKHDKIGIVSKGKIKSTSGGYEISNNLVDSSAEFYCMCELFDVENSQVIKVNVYSAHIIDKSTNSYPADSLMGSECLSAVANDLEQITVKGNKYKVLRTVRYDTKFVDSFTDNKLQKKDALAVEAYELREMYKALDFKTVYVYYKLNNICKKRKHAIEIVKMHTTDIFKHNSIDVSVYYCDTCKKYWVNYDAMKDMFERGIRPALKYRVVNDSTELMPVSELMMYGYNVRAGVLSDAKRQSLLKFIIDNKLMEKQEIISNIQFKVEFNGKKTGNENAKQKWQDDIYFISQYVSKQDRRIVGELVRK